MSISSVFDKQFIYHKTCEKNNIQKKIILFEYVDNRKNHNSFFRVSIKVYECIWKLRLNWVLKNK